MVKLGAKEEAGQDAPSPPAAAAPPRGAGARPRASTGQPAPTLQVDDGFDRAWRRVGIALDRSGFTVEDRDRAQGLYFVRYVDPAFAGREEPNFFSQAVQLRQEGRRRGLAKYRVKVNAEGNATSTVAVLDSQGKPETRRSRQADRQPAPRRPEVSAAARRQRRRVIRFCSLGSGSSGNATVVEATSGITTTRLLVDAGFSLRELETRAGARRARAPTTSMPSSSPTSTATTSAARWRSPSATTCRCG